MNPLLFIVLGGAVGFYIGRKTAHVFAEDTTGRLRAFYGKG